MGNLVFHSGLHDRRYGISAGDDADGVMFGQGLGYGSGALTKFFLLEETDGTVPEYHSRITDLLNELADGFGADVQAQQIRWDAPVHSDRVLLRLFRRYMVDRKKQRYSETLRLVDEVARERNTLFFDQGPPDFDAFCFEKSVGHSAADQQAVHFRDQVFQHADLVRDLGPPRMATKGLSGLERIRPR